jgi:hypothetical protein
MNKRSHLFCLVAAASISGCIVAPGTSTRTAQMSGRVLSAATRQPIPGARVALHEAPRLRAATTDSQGRFSLAESRNFHLFLFLGICGPDYDILPAIRDEIDVSHPGYSPQRIDAWRHAARKTLEPVPVIELKDILLRPSGR